LGRRAEKQGSLERAERAYDAAIQLDDANPDAALAMVAFRARQGRVMDALKAVPPAAAALFATHESRVAMLSLVGLFVAVAVGGVGPRGQPRAGAAPPAGGRARHPRERRLALRPQRGPPPAPPDPRPAALRGPRPRVADPLLGRAALPVRARPGAPGAGGRAD